jgi:hypothetical protein
VQDSDRPGRCGISLAKHRAYTRRSQAAFYVPRSELRKLLPGNCFLPPGQLLRVRQDAVKLGVERTGAACQATVLPQGLAGIVPPHGMEARPCLHALAKSPHYGACMVRAGSPNKQRP